ncbi:TetR/AcrR family transcriptional regulator [Leifsonia sp. 71-9]|uniref:TetR/AcrR family transcriptional regulator n=1 Tax=Leifsonia sp. 71-9 TaxID=1895934 RepID=UPI0009275173|nr:TetR/AcrR family transcriptional regulator [Leifsonia sp. 71-9]OJX73897.1 MAG: TetR family transcriptional regulator [Leifsonia sp. 71-9]
MSSPETATTRSRAPRADAARNRALLVDAARAAFASGGEQVSLEAIAREAGVGIGTLYRNFPTREDLIAAVYASELDAVIAAADGLHDARPADVALRTWLDRYAAFVMTKRGMAESLRAGALADAANTAHTRERVNGAVGAFLQAGAQTGVLRGDLAADDVTTALVGLFLATRDVADPAQIARLLDLLVDGLRARP